MKLFMRPLFLRLVLAHPANGILFAFGGDPWPE